MGSTEPLTHAPLAGISLPFIYIVGSELISLGCYEGQTLWLSAEGQSLGFLSAISRAQRNF